MTRYRVKSLLLGAALAAVAMAGAGCGQVERTMTITSDPSGALVYVNGVEKGRTPVTFEFVWYGDYRIELRKEGYETVKDHRNVRAPWHQWVGVDLMTELFYPGKLTDHQTFHFAMAREVPSSEETLERLARQRRDEAQLKPD
ncbi:MAG: hypothetical protein BIFFINMI_03115 [Phycisphaerae bacterium]|nr:hypothetical protein [Phycisphaerae bacterium]